MNWIEKLLDPCKNDREIFQAKLKRESEERVRLQKMLVYVAAKKTVDGKEKRQ